MESVKSLDKVHGYSGQSPGNTLRLDNVHGLSGQSLDNVHGLPGQCPWTQMKVWTMSMDTLDKVQGATLDWTMSMDSVDIVHNIVHCLPGECLWTSWTLYPWTGKCGHCPLIPWTVSRQTGQCQLNPWTKLLFVLTELVKKT